jgi:hypothetical protein
MLVNLFYFSSRSRELRTSIFSDLSKLSAGEEGGEKQEKRPR